MACNKRTFSSLRLPDQLDLQPIGRGTRMIYAKKVDTTHGIVRDGLRSAGYFVVDMSAVGKDFPDLLAVSKAGLTVLLEVKTEGEYPTEGQCRFLFRYPGPASLVFDVEDALKVMARYD
jgi:hypothetical protein